MVLEVEGYVVSGEVERWNMHFRQDTGVSSYDVTVYPTHELVELIRHDEIRFLFLVGNGAAPTMNGEAPDRIQIIARGAEIAAYLNGEPALYINDEDGFERMGGTDLGLRVCHTGSEPMDMRFDNLRIWDISGLILESE
jgi:hypothetical protein